MNGISRRAAVAGLVAFASSFGLSSRTSAQADIAASGNGGSAGAGANGGTVVVGGNSDVGCIGANGGIATADASGGDDNNAIVGSGDVISFPEFVPYPNTPCVPGTYVENGRGNLVAFCTAAGRWIN